MENQNQESITYALDVVIGSEPYTFEAIQAAIDETNSQFNQNGGFDSNAR